MNDPVEAAPLRVIARRKHVDSEAPFMSLLGLGFTAFAVMAIVACVALFAGRV
jgi:hypothetical protein